MLVLRFKLLNQLLRASIWDQGYRCCSSNLRIFLHYINTEYGSVTSHAILPVSAVLPSQTGKAYIGALKQMYQLK